jgi:energy-converting hydrogenase Eha subunit G
MIVFQPCPKDSGDSVARNELVLVSLFWWVMGVVTFQSRPKKRLLTVTIAACPVLVPKVDCPSGGVYL